MQVYQMGGRRILRRLGQRFWTGVYHEKNRESCPLFTHTVNSNIPEMP